MADAVESVSGQGHEWTNGHQVLYGKTVEEVRWRECVSYVNSNMESAVGSLYVKKAFSRDSKTLVGAGTRLRSGDSVQPTQGHRPMRVGGRSRRHHPVLGPRAPREEALCPPPPRPQQCGCFQWGRRGCWEPTFALAAFPKGEALPVGACAPARRWPCRLPGKGFRCMSGGGRP